MKAQNQINYSIALLILVFVFLFSFSLFSQILYGPTGLAGVQSQITVSEKFEDAEGNPINWDNANEFTESGVFWRHPISQKIISALPLGYATHNGVDADSDGIGDSEYNVDGNGGNDNYPLMEAYGWCTGTGWE